MSMMIGWIMFLCIVPTLLICFVQIYPKKWKDKKLIFGVKNRKEFKEGNEAEEVDGIVKKYRGYAQTIVVAGCVIAVSLLLLHGITLQITLWTAFILFAILAINIPYIFGNKEMKSLKRRMGLISKANVSYTDLSNAGAVHALQPVQIWIPTLCSLALVVVALLLDLKVITIGTNTTAGTFQMTLCMGIYGVCNLLYLVMAYAFDGMKNEVISADSSVNANYNRAKKKNMADMLVWYAWGMFVLMACLLLSFVLIDSDLLFMIAIGIFMVLVMFTAALFVAREKKIEARYGKEMTLLSDDDDLWIAGSIYYNPRDKRLTVEKRVGVGATINAAHPVGKVLFAVIVLSLVFTVLCLVWMGMVEATPIRLRAEEDKLVCHQLRDDYVIPYAEIESVEWGEDITEHSLKRVAGVGMEQLLKGSFSIDGKSGCKVFLVPQEKVFIKITALDGTAYYVSGAGAAETREAYEMLTNALYTPK